MLFHSIRVGLCLCLLQGLDLLIFTSEINKLYHLPMAALPFTYNYLPPPGGSSRRSCRPPGGRNRKLSCLSAATSCGSRLLCFLSAPETSQPKNLPLPLSPSLSNIHQTFLQASLKRPEEFYGEPSVWKSRCLLWRASAPACSVSPPLRTAMTADRVFLSAYFHY